MEKSRKLNEINQDDIKGLLHKIQYYNKIDQEIREALRVFND